MRRQVGQRANAASIADSLQLADPSWPWQPLPPWLAFYCKLGEQVAAQHEAGTKTCCVVIPPVRSFGAVLAATGAVVGVALTAEAVPDVDTHFTSLASLDKGAALVVKMGDRIYAAIFGGIAERDGHEYLKVEYDEMIHYLPKQESHRAQVGRGGKRSLPKSARRFRSESTSAIENLLGDHAIDFLSVPTVDVVLVGKVSLLEQELTSVKVREARSTAAAPLGALLRPSRFLPDGGISRSMVLSDRVSEFEMPVRDVPHVAVFDGPRALARHRTQFRESSWIAVLDRCSTAFREGVDVANQEFATRRGTAPYLGKLNIPPGTEAQAFERAR